MCLSTVYASGDTEHAIMEYVAKIRVDGSEITFTDVMGEEKKVSGRLVMADLTGAVVEVALDQ